MTTTTPRTRSLAALDGGVCAVDGITAAGIAAGLKPSGKPDLALIAAPATVSAAGVETRNQVKAAPVVLTRRHLGDGRARAILLNAGSANVCTGPDGYALAEEAAALTAAQLGCAATDILVCSTGVIGVPIPRQPYLAGIPQAAAALRRDGGDDAARAIMTTDSGPKQAAVRVTDERGTCVVGGVAKGAGMIAPAMATMLCVLTTDAPLAGPIADALLREAVSATFDRISVDGSMSTNDTVLLLATGTAPQPASLAGVTAAITAVCDQLADAIVRDGEGATRVLHVNVTGARSRDEALRVARQVAGDNLVKTALAGGDPNWGRVIAAVGASPVPIDPDRIAIRFGRVEVCRFGVATAFDRGLAATQLQGPDVELRIDLGLGDADASVRTCDLTTEYVRINSEYTT